MRTTILTFFLMASISLYTFAGDKSGNSYFKWGPKFGLNLTADMNNPPSNIDAITDQLQGNYQIGGFMQFGKKFYFQPEFYYAVQNVRSDNRSVTYERFKAPVHIGLKFFDLGLLSLHISGGVMYSQDTKEQFSFDSKNFELQLGAGVDVLDFVTTDLRYTLRQGVSMADQISDFAEYGGVVNLTVGLKFK